MANRGDALTFWISASARSVGSVLAKTSTPGSATANRRSESERVAEHPRW
jgi:hypothetical protein